MSGDYETDDEWTLIGGMRRDVKMVTEEDGGSREMVELALDSTEAAGGIPIDAAMRLFFKYGDGYHRCEIKDRTRFSEWPVSHRQRPSHPAAIVRGPY